MNLSDWIEKTAEAAPDRIAVRFAGDEVGYEALAGRIRAAAQALEDDLSVQRGDRVAHLGYNSLAMLVLLFACARIGAIFTPLNWRLAPPELAFILEDSGARLLFAEPEFAEPVAATGEAAANITRVSLGAAPEGWLSWPTLMAARDSDHKPRGAGGDPVLLVYTSGTTGRPKGALLTQDALYWNALNSAGMHELSDADHVLTVIPMFHVGGLNIQTLPVLHAGGTTTLHPRFDADAVLEAIERDRPTLCVLVPPMMAALLDHPRWETADLSSLRMVTTGSSIVPLPLIRGFHARGLPVIQVYGSTETAPIATCLARADAQARIGSAGRPATHCEVRLVNGDGGEVAPGQAGEILIRGPNLMREYWGDEAATAEALRGGWFHSGDIGHLDADGYLYVDERKGDMIISGGENIYQAELEAVLADCPQIAECAVVARPDERWGEVPVAVVAPRQGAEIDRKGVLGLFENRIARFKHPKDVLFLAALPRNAMGKVQKYRLREILGRNRR
ncbi:MAG: long-chain fatty acid--CoA ligase [Alphaproteobacteria bacterium]